MDTADNSIPANDENRQIHSPAAALAPSEALSVFISGRILKTAIISVNTKTAASKALSQNFNILCDRKTTPLRDIYLHLQRAC
jgi:nicotinate-nucleotide pyrophosphorylase